MYIVNTIAPVFLVIALGLVLRRAGFLSSELAAGISKVAYWVALPALLFGEVAKAFGTAAGLGNALVIVVAGVGGAMLAAYLAARAMRMTGGQTGAFVQAAFRGNLTYVGLAVIISAFPAGGHGSPQAAAVLVLAPIVPLHSVLAIIVLLAGQHTLSRAAVGKMAWQIVTNPLLLACVAAMLWAIGGVRMPTAIERTLSVIGQIALPAALLAIGAGLADIKLAGNVLPSVAASLIKVGLAPAIGYVAALALGAGPTETAVALIMLACPTATVSYILTEQLQGDTKIAAGAVVVSTVLSIISLSVVLAAVM